MTIISAPENVLSKKNTFQLINRCEVNNMLLSGTFLTWKS